MHLTIYIYTPFYLYYYKGFYLFLRLIIKLSTPCTTLTGLSTVPGDKMAENGGNLMFLRDWHQGHPLPKAPAKIKVDRIPKW